MGKKEILNWCSDNMEFLSLLSKSVVDSILYDKEELSLILMGASIPLEKNEKEILLEVLYLMGYEAEASFRFNEITKMNIFSLNLNWRNSLSSTPWLQEYLFKLEKKDSIWI